MKLGRVKLWAGLPHAPLWLLTPPAHVLARPPASVLQPRAARLGVARFVRHWPDPNHLYAVLVSSTGL